MTYYKPIKEERPPLDLDNITFQLQTILKYLKERVWKKVEDKPSQLN
jgi:hypothetical protein